MQCLAIMAPVAYIPCFRSDITICIYGCTSNNSSHKCQQAKPNGPSHSLLPSRDISGAPWEEVAVDLIGPWHASSPYDDVEFFDLTYIDTTTNLIKLTRIIEKSDNNIATYLEHIWLSWYPELIQVIHDKGGELIGFSFQQLLVVEHKVGPNHKQEPTV